MIYVLKGMLIVFVVSFAIVALFLFAGFMWREWQLDLRAKRSARGRLLSDPPIAREYTTKDYPAWERRFEYARGRALAAKLRELGQ